MRVNAKDISNMVYRIQGVYNDLMRATSMLSNMQSVKGRTHLLVFHALSN